MEQANILDLEQAAQAVLLPLDCITAGENDRTVFKAEHIRELAESMAAHGLAQPITVRPVCLLTDRYEVVAGERRLRAAQLLQWDRIPAIIRELTDEQAAAIMLLENVHRRDIDPVDEAWAYRRRMERFGWSEEQVASHANVTVDRVRRRLKLLRLFPDALKMVSGGQLPLGHAELLSELDANRQVIALRPLVGGKSMSLRAFREMVDDLLAQQSQESMFDLAELWTQGVAELADTQHKRRPTGCRVDPRLPEMRETKGKGSIGRVILAYAKQLQEEGFEEEALAIETLLDKLVRTHWTRV